jgi:hypothetical protein
MKDKHLGVRLPEASKGDLEKWLKDINRARTRDRKEPIKMSELVRAVLVTAARDRPDVGLL